MNKSGKTVVIPRIRNNSAETGAFVTEKAAPAGGEFRPPGAYQPTPVKTLTPKPLSIKHKNS